MCNLPYQKQMVEKTKNLQSSILDSQSKRLLSFYNCHDLLAKVLHNCPCLHISLLVFRTSHFSIFSPSSLFLITMSPLAHLADSAYSMRTPKSFCFCNHFFSSFLTHWNKRRCQNASKEMAQCTKMCDSTSTIRLKCGLTGCFLLGQGPKEPMKCHILGGTGVQWALETNC